MLKKIKTFIVVAVAGLTFSAPALVPAMVGIASADSITTGLCNGVTDATGGSTSNSCINGGTDANASLAKLAKEVINILSIIVGVIAVIMIIVGGFRYITSGGESSNVSGAKNTLIYAIVGLVIVAIAQFIVHFVLSTAGNAGLTQ